MIHSSIPSILVVDDDSNALFTISQMLSDEGYKILTASYGREAVEDFQKKFNQVGYFGY